MIELGTALCWVGLYLALFFAYYKYYFRPRLYLLMLGDEAYLDHYLARLPHMKDRPGERFGMVEFLMDKRVAFVRENRLFLIVATLFLVLALAFSAR